MTPDLAAGRGVGVDAGVVLGGAVEAGVGDRVVDGVVGARLPRDGAHHQLAVCDWSILLILGSDWLIMLIL